MSGQRTKLAQILSHKAWYSGQRCGVRTSRIRRFGQVERSTGLITEICKLNVVAKKRSDGQMKSWDELHENDKKKLGMDSADPQNRSEWCGRLRERLVRKLNSQ